MDRMSSNLEKPGGISEMSAVPLITQEEKAKQYNISNAPRISDGDPRSKRSLASYERNDMGEVSENLVSLWEIVKNGPPVYLEIYIERERFRPLIRTQRVCC